MFGDKAIELIKELDRTKQSQLPDFNEDLVRKVIEEMKVLFEQNQKDAAITATGNLGYFAGVHLRHSALERNKRCLLAYLYHRLERIKVARWELGSILPPDLRSALCEPEIQWFNKYNSNLATYMCSLGEGIGLDITQDVLPPKDIYVEVRCCEDYGELELEGNDVVLLKKGTFHTLPVSYCQHLIRQGILEHID